MSDPVRVPVQTRLRMAHGCLEHLAREAEVKILHLKGVALHPLLAEGRTPSTDCDVLVDAVEATTLRASLHGTSAPQNYLPAEQIAEVTVAVEAGRSWVHLPLHWEPETARNGVVTLHANTGVSVHRGSWVEPGTVTMIHREMPEDERYTEQWREWKETLHGSGICFRATSTTEAYRAEQVRGGYSRPYGGPNMWVSAPTAEDPQPWIELSWAEPVRLGRVEIIFDDDVNEDLINLHHHRTEAEVMPSLVRDARVEALVGGAWREVARVEGIRERRWAAECDEPWVIDALRVVVEDASGAPDARVVAVRAMES